MGSAATLIGNPQNMLIGQALGLDFARYALIALLPTVLAVVWGVIYGLDRDALRAPDEAVVSATPSPRAVGPDFDPWQAGKGLALAAILLVLFFFSDWPREVIALAVAAVVLSSRRRVNPRDPVGLFLLAPVLSVIVSNVPAVLLLLPFAVHPLAGRSP